MRTLRQPQGTTCRASREGKWPTREGDFPPSKEEGLRSYQGRRGRGPALPSRDQLCTGRKGPSRRPKYHSNGFPARLSARPTEQRVRAFQRRKGRTNGQLSSEPRTGLRKRSRPAYASERNEQGRLTRQEGGVEPLRGRPQRPVRPKSEAKNGSEDLVGRRVEWRL